MSNKIFHLGASWGSGPPPVVAPQFISSASVVGSSITVPDHLPGDLLVIVTFRNNSATSPGNVTGYSAIGAGGANLCSHRTLYKIATGTSDGSGSSANATHMLAAVYRAPAGQKYVGFGVTSTGGFQSGTTNTLSYPAVTLGRMFRDGTSLIIAVAAHKSGDQNLSAPPYLLTNKALLTDSAGMIALFDSTGGYPAGTDYAANDVTLTGTAAAHLSNAFGIYLYTESLHGAFDHNYLTGGDAVLSNGERTVTLDGTSVYPHTHALTDTNNAADNFYLEFLVNAVDSADTVTGNTTACVGFSQENYIGNALWYHPSGEVWFNVGSVQLTMPSYTAGDVICIAAKTTSFGGPIHVWFRKNGGNWNNDPTADPVADVNGLTNLTFNANSNAGVTEGLGPTTQYTVRTETSQFGFSVPSGYKPWYAGAPFIDGAGVVNNGSSVSSLALPGIATSNVIDLIVVDVAVDGQTVTSITSTNGLVFTKHASIGGSNNLERWIAKGQSVLYTSEVMTINLSGSASFVSAAAYAIRGLNLVSSYPNLIADGAPATDSTMPADPALITNNGLKRLVVAAFRMNSVSAPTPGAGTTQIAVGSSLMVNYKVSLTAASVSVGLATGLSDSNGSIIDAFK